MLQDWDRSLTVFCCCIRNALRNIRYEKILLTRRSQLLPRHERALRTGIELGMMTLAGVFVLLAVLGQTSGHFGPNIARDGKVTQSSLGWQGVPERAIDGNRASNWGKRSCTHTSRQTKPWWRLDLLKKYKIDTVTITNRKDCCHKRINGAEIRIGNSLNDNGNANPRCAVISSIAAGTSKTFMCDFMEGQYVNIVIPGRKEYLTLCEVEVTGIELNDSIENPCG
ncbi:fucolectin-like [Epinephelus fuscoguttatus]|uniref:fucolectin-like n=1 Tax=Epinephelus fuscoguttatus TaxID=293821 RepID=UPI0020D0867A|nr:fucolectin-like [Epinephelus fuscoguttatus]